MTLPNFIGIGAIRCGSTWLYDLLKSHPQIYVPTRRKEINFFSENYDKGPEWYESFFPEKSTSYKYKVLGEISPRYLIFPATAQRIASLTTINKIIGILRNPVDRAYSHYGHTIYLRGYEKNFEDFLEDFPDVLTHGKYATLLNPFLDSFPKDYFHFFVFENSISNLELSKNEIARIFQVDASQFPSKSGSQKINSSGKPRSKILNYWASSLRNNLQSKDLDWVINFAKQAGMQKLLRSKSGTPIPPMKLETRQKLQDFYAGEIDKLEGILNINLNVWR